MSGKKFEFDKNALEACAKESQSLQKSQLTASKEEESSKESALSCRKLYQAYCQHYQRDGFSNDRFFKFQETVQFIYNHNFHLNNKNNKDNNNSEENYYYHHHHKSLYHVTLNQFSDSLELPVQSYSSSWKDTNQQNNNDKDDETGQDKDGNDKDENNWDDDDDDDYKKNIWHAQLRKRGLLQSSDSSVFVPLDEEWKIRRRYSYNANQKVQQQQENEGFMSNRDDRNGNHHHHRRLAGHHRYHPNMTHKKKKHKKKDVFSPPKLSWHHYVNDQPFNVVDLPKKGIGVEMDLKSTHHFEKIANEDDDSNNNDNNNISSNNNNNNNDDDSNSYNDTTYDDDYYYDDDADNFSNGQENNDNNTLDQGNATATPTSSTTEGVINQRRRDKFAKSLNWATRNNPDKVPLVHEVFDQGPCGSCWAYSATGSLETSAARRAGHDAYLSMLTELEQQQPQDQQQNYRYSRSQARRAARQIESDMFQSSRLSIQELIDCDTAADQGCVGGNPLLAFFYIRKYGLVTWDEYGYTASADTCQLDKIAHPIVSVESWGALPKNHENMIELALRYIGPVAVAINAADSSFIAYGGGIYDNPTCAQKGNHALLVVGYGEEQVQVAGTDTWQVVRYWIARNSWGSGWGEKGYMRIKRGPGGQKTKGVCGIARSPSVALGGEFHLNRTTVLVDEEDDPTIQENLDYSVPTEPPIENAMCDYVFREDGIPHLACIEVSVAFYRHKAASLGILSIILALLSTVVPLSLQCCIRRRRRRRLSSLSGSMVSSIRSHRSLRTESPDTLPDGNEGKPKPMNGNDPVLEDENTPILRRPNEDYGGTDQTNNNNTAAAE